MAKISAQGKRPALQFAAYLRRWAELSGKKDGELAALLGLHSSSFSQYKSGAKPCSFGKMIEISEKIGKELVDILAEGKAILAGETPAEPISADPQTKDVLSCLCGWQEKYKKEVEAHRISVEAHVRAIIALTREHDRILEALNLPPFGPYTPSGASPPVGALSTSAEKGVSDGSD